MINNISQIGGFYDKKNWIVIYDWIKNSIIQVMETWDNWSLKVPKYDQSLWNWILLLKPDWLDKKHDIDYILNDFWIKTIEQKIVTFDERIIYTLYPNAKWKNRESDILDYMLHKEWMWFHLSSNDIFSKLFFIKKWIRNHFLWDKLLRSNKVINIIHTTINEQEYQKDMKLFF